MTFMSAIVYIYLHSITKNINYSYLFTSRSHDKVQNVTLFLPYLKFIEYFVTTIRRK